MELTKVELDIINILRTLPPFGKIEISADKSGKFDSYLVHKSEKIILEPKSQQKDWGIAK